MLEDSNDSAQLICVLHRQISPILDQQGDLQGTTWYPKSTDARIRVVRVRYQIPRSVYCRTRRTVGTLMANKEVAKLIV